MMNFKRDHWLSLIVVSVLIIVASLNYIITQINPPAKSFVSSGDTLFDYKYSKTLVQKFTPQGFMDSHLEFLVYMTRDTMYVVAGAIIIGQAYWSPDTVRIDSIILKYIKENE